jgi:ribonuclease PH
MPRSFNRADNAMRPLTLTADISRHAEGSCLVEFGHTKVLCAASVDDRTPPWMRNSGKGWVTAEYGMLPRATNSRNPREAAKGKQSGRTQEIQRLIGRALRASIHLELLGERQITIDCDVLEADGGTRTAAITGGYVALHRAIQHLRRTQQLATDPMIAPIAAVSCGIVKGRPVLDLDYEEDSSAEVDANFVMAANGKTIELQMSGEEAMFDDEALHAMLALAKKGIADITAKQAEALGITLAQEDAA